MRWIPTSVLVECLTYVGHFGELMERLESGIQRDLFQLTSDWSGGGSPGGPTNVYRWAFFAVYFRPSRFEGPQPLTCLRVPRVGNGSERCHRPVEELDWHLERAPPEPVIVEGPIRSPANGTKGIPHPPNSPFLLLAATAPTTRLVEQRLQ